MLNQLEFNSWWKCSLLLCLIFTAESFWMINVQAQPPAITALSPAGGQLGTTVEVTLVGKPGTTPLQAACLSDPPLEITVAEKGNSLTVQIPTQASPGIHWIRFLNSAGCNTLLPFHVGLIPETVEKEPNNNTSDAGQPLNLPLVVNGVLEKSGEIDQFPIALKTGETLVASLDTHRSLGSPLDGVLQLADADGFVLSDNDDDHGFDPLLNWTATRDGIYYLRVFGFPANPNSTINYAGGSDYVYRLSLTTGPFVAYALPAQTTTASVETGHWLVEGWNLQEADKTNPLLTPGLHWLQPEKVRSSPVQTGTATDPATLPVQRFGRLEHPEVQGDTLIRLEKDQNVEIRIRARQLDSLLDPVLLIREQEKVLREVDDIAKEELDVATTWKAPSTGDFTFSVIDRYGHAGARYFYLLEVESALPRIECSVDAENFTGKAGAPLEIPITINRLNGFTEAVTFNVTGLTENQTVEHVVSETKGDSAKKVTLKIQHNGKEPFQGPVQIIAHWGEETGNEQLVTRSLKLPDYKIDQFWVTLPVEK